MFRLIVIASLCLGLMACGGDKGDAPPRYEVTVRAAANGSLNLHDQYVFEGKVTWATIVPDPHYKLLSIKGCGGKLEKDVYFTGPVWADCVLMPEFTAETYTVTVNTAPGGSGTPATQDIAYNTIAKITFSPDEGYQVKSVSGCGGILTGKTYTTAPITSACSITPAFEPAPATSTAAINGVAAEGAALANVAIAAKCADGSGFVDAVITDNQGNFSGQVATTALPCALVVEDAKSGTTYYSLATETGRVNITPFTSLAIAYASQQVGAEWLADSDWQSTATQLSAAQTQLGIALAKAGYHLPEGAFLPVTTEFKVGDDWDKALDQLHAAIQSSNNIGSFDELVNVVKDGNLGSLPAPQ